MYVVTGAAGFIGSAFVWELNQRGIKDIVVADDWGHGPKWKNLAKRQVSDFVPKDDLFAYLDRHAANVTAIVHMGACSTTTELNVDFLLDNNFRYSQKLFRWCTDHAKPFMYASSCATYGAGEHGFDDATDAQDLRPLNPYGYSKVIFDRWALSQKRTPPFWVGLKYSNVYGPNEYHKEDQSSVVFKAFRQIEATGVLNLFKSYKPEYRDGEQMRDFIYVKDATAWMYALLERGGTSGVYNCGFGKARTWKDLAHAVFGAMSRADKIEFIQMPESLRDHYQYFTEAKMDRLHARGLPRPKYSLEAGIADYVQNYLAQKDPYL